MALVDPSDLNGSSIALYDRIGRLTISIPSGSFSDTDPTLNTVIIGSGEDAGDPGLRIVAKITKTNKKEPNTAEITVYNLAPTTRAQLQQKGSRVLLEAGYRGGGYSRVFLGDERTADHRREGPDVVTVLKCGDGERSVRYSRAAESFAGGSTVAQVVRYCADQMGLALGNVSAQLPALEKKLFQGWTAHGAASSELDRVLRAVGYSYSIQDGEIQILAPTQSIAQTVPLLSPQTGLLGSPEMGSPEQKGKTQSLKFRSLLLPEARPGGRVHVQSERYNGIYRINKVTHSLDTGGGDWFTDYETVADPTAQVA